MRVAETREDREGERLPVRAEAEAVGEAGRGKHRAVLPLLRSSDEGLEAGRPLDRHDRREVGQAGGADGQARAPSAGSAVSCRKVRKGHCAPPRERLYRRALSIGDPGSGPLEMGA